jgi:hypothetical protein
MEALPPLSAEESDAIRKSFPSNVRSFLKEYAGDFEITPYKKLHCVWTGHDLLPNLDKLKTHVATSRFTTAKKSSQVDLSQYQHIVPHKRSAHRCYCLLTRRELNKNREEIEKHINGRRYKAALSFIDSNSSNNNEEEPEIPDFVLQDLPDDAVAVDEDESEEEEEADEPKRKKTKASSSTSSSSNSKKGNGDKGKEQDKEKSSKSKKATSKSRKR